MVSAGENTDTQGEATRCGRRSAIRDQNGTHGSCTSISKHSEALMPELGQVRMHGAALQRQGTTQNLVYDGEYPSEDWASLESRRNWLQHHIFRTGDSRTPVPLTQNSSAPPLHTNAFKKSTQKKEQLEGFKSFVAANSIPTGDSSMENPITSCHRSEELALLRS
eukprot:IDg10732t1